MVRLVTALRGAVSLAAGRWEVGGGRWEEEVRWEGFGSVWCGPRCCGSVRYGSGRFDTILGESIEKRPLPYL